MTSITYRILNEYDTHTPLRNKVEGLKKRIKILGRNSQYYKHDIEEAKQELLLAVNQLQVEDIEKESSLKEQFYNIKNTHASEEEICD